MESGKAAEAPVLPNVEMPRVSASTRIMRLLLFVVAMVWGILVISSFDQSASMVKHGGYRDAYARLISTRNRFRGKDDMGKERLGGIQSGPGRPGGEATSVEKATADEASVNINSQPLVAPKEVPKPPSAAAAPAQKDASAAVAPLPKAAIKLESKILEPYAAVSEVGPNAIITMVAGNSAARNAVAWLQSLVDVGTSYPVIIMLQQGGGGSPECLDRKFMRDRDRGTIRCDGNLTVAEEIVSPFYTKILRRLGAHLMVTPEIPRTRYTSSIAGGSQLFWGMSLNRLQIFKMTQFSKLLYMDSDTLVLQVRERPGQTTAVYSLASAGGRALRPARFTNFAARAERERHSTLPAIIPRVRSSPRRIWTTCLAPNTPCSQQR